MRYFSSVKLNGKEVGRGIGSSKKQAKHIATVRALKNIAPTLYEQWRVRLNKIEMEAACDLHDEAATLNQELDTELIIKETIIRKEEEKTITSTSVEHEPSKIYSSCYVPDSLQSSAS